jgi:hypothetical protein
MPTAPRRVGIADGSNRLAAEYARAPAVVELELGQQSRDVRLDGCDAHVQVGRDLGVRLALRDGDADLALAVGETLEEATGHGAAGVGAALGEVREQVAGDGRREHRLARGDEPHGLEDRWRRRVLEQEAARAGAIAGRAVLTRVEDAGSASRSGPAVATTLGLRSRSVRGHFWIPTNGIVSAPPRSALVPVATAQVTLGRP